MDFASTLGCPVQSVNVGEVRGVLGGELVQFRLDRFRRKRLQSNPHAQETYLGRRAERNTVAEALATSVRRVSTAAGHKRLLFPSLDRLQLCGAVSRYTERSG